MLRDPIVEEVRRHRDEYAKRFNYDLRAICHSKREVDGREYPCLLSR